MAHTTGTVLTVTKEVKLSNVVSAGESITLLAQKKITVATHSFALSVW